MTWEVCRASCVSTVCTWHTEVFTLISKNPIPSFDYLRYSLNETFIFQINLLQRQGAEQKRYWSESSAEGYMKEQTDKYFIRKKRKRKIKLN